MFYHNDDDLGEKINYYLSNPKEREEIAKRVYDFIYENHTYENRAKLILSKIEIKK
jgi:hypothetical protein